MSGLFSPIASRYIIAKEISHGFGVRSAQVNQNLASGLAIKRQGGDDEIAILPGSSPQAQLAPVDGPAPARHVPERAVTAAIMVSEYIPTTKQFPAIAAHRP